MNGFEPLLRRTVDYTRAGQWHEVYDGPIEESPEEMLKDENARLRELARDLFALALPRRFEVEVADEVYERYDPCERCKKVMGDRYPCRHGFDSTDEMERVGHLYCDMFRADVVAAKMRELGIEVD